MVVSLEKINKCIPEAKLYLLKQSLCSGFVLTALVHSRVGHVMGRHLHHVSRAPVYTAGLTWHHNSCEAKQGVHACSQSTWYELSCGHAQNEWSARIDLSWFVETSKDTLPAACLCFRVWTLFGRRTAIFSEPWIHFTLLTRTKYKLVQRGVFSWEKSM